MLHGELRQEQTRNGKSKGNCDRALTKVMAKARISSCRLHSLAVLRHVHLLAWQENQPRQRPMELATTRKRGHKPAQPSKPTTSDFWHLSPVTLCYVDLHACGAQHNHAIDGKRSKAKTFGRAKERGGQGKGRVEWSKGGMEKCSKHWALSWLNICSPSGCSAAFSPLSSSDRSTCSHGKSTSKGREQWN